MKGKEEQLIDLISKEVIRQLQQIKTKTNLEKTPVLVLGDIELLNESDNKKDYYTIEDYIENDNMEKYEYVIITQIANYQLCDISLGRDNTPFTCAIQKSLLLGKDIYLMEEALVFRNFIQTSNSKLYNLLEAYVSKLEEFGIKILSKDMKDIQVKSKEKIDSRPIYDSSKRLITESLAKNICKEDKKSIGFPKGTIITPLAKDVFMAANKELTLY